jgi:O-antigen ligase
VGLCAALAIVAALALGIGSDELDESSGNRFELIGGGLSMVADRPLWGYGSGSFSERFRDREDASSRRASSASHTIPVTVAAEQGVIGLAAYLLVVGASLRLLFSGLGPLRGRDPPRRLLTRAFAAAAFDALVVHTLLYASFLEDPIAWTLLGVGIVLAEGGPLAPAATRRPGLAGAGP